MNERFASDPTSCESTFELKHLLSLFGPFAGRFLAQYPDEWANSIVEHVAHGKVMERKRAEELLIRAKQKAALVKISSLIWLDNQSWADNASRLAKSHPPKLDGLIVSRGVSKPTINSYSLDDLELPPTSAEHIEATPDEYGRVARFLLLSSREIAFVDPYLNLADSAVRSVVQSIFAIVARGKCTKITCFARADVVLRGEMRTTIEHLQFELNKLVDSTFTGRTCEVLYYLLDDSRSRERMHDRYLLTRLGGVQFGQGFKQLGRGRKVLAEPVGMQPHTELTALFLDCRHSMAVTHTLKAQPICP